MAAKYICPVCHAQNHEHMKYCYKCGTWLLSTAYPAKKVNSTATRRWYSTIPIILFLVLLAIFFYKWDNTIRFDRIEIGEEFVVSQLAINRPLFREPKAAADLTAMKNIEYPFEVRTIYYDDKGNRLGTASALIVKGMYEGQTTTINLKFESITSSLSISQVRLEINPLSPLELLERAADIIKK